MATKKKKTIQRRCSFVRLFVHSLTPASLMRPWNSSTPESRLLLARAICVCVCAQSYGTLGDTQQRRSFSLILRVVPFHKYIYIYSFLPFLPLALNTERTLLTLLRSFFRFLFILLAAASLLCSSCSLIIRISNRFLKPPVWCVSLEKLLLFDDY